MSTPPKPNYDYDVNRLVEYFRKALAKIQNELDSLLLTDFKRAQLLATQAHIAKVLKQLNVDATEWVDTSIQKAVENGIADTIFALGLAETYEEAKKIVKFNRMNQELVKAIVADTQSDLLAVTQNVDRRVKAAIRQVSAQVMREKYTQGINKPKDLSREIVATLRKQLGESADMAIIDAAGRRWKLTVYADMLARTKMMQAQRESSRNEALSRGVQYGVISKHSAKDACSKWEGRIIKLDPNAPGDYPYIDDLPRREIFHPNCRHVVTPIRNPERV